MLKFLRRWRSGRRESLQRKYKVRRGTGITHATHAISNPKYPLSESLTKNLLKLSINLGSVYENAVAQELASHGFKLLYYDNRSKGEVDFLIDDHNTISVLPVDVKSGKDYTKHSALDNFMRVPDYHISSALVLNYLCPCV